MHQKEIHIVRFSMIVLFSSLMIVYLLLYQIKGDDIVNQLSSISTTKPVEIENMYNDNKLDLEKFDKENELIEETPTEETPTDKMEDGGNSLFDGNIGTGLDENTNKIIVLSGTSLRYGRVDAVEKLGISYQYALKDTKDIYYVFLDPQRYEFNEIIKSLGGSTYTISTEKEIVENKLFGEKITFVNLPEYKEKKVVLLVNIDKKLRLIQIDYDKYHNSKTYIKNLFIN